MTHSCLQCAGPRNVGYLLNAAMPFSREDFCSLMASKWAVSDAWLPSDTALPLVTGGAAPVTSAAAVASPASCPQQEQLIGTEC